jgi:spore coat polysaccharide biosynthesis protein SpsF
VIGRPRTVAIVQARMGSTRLPGKCMMDIGGRPMLARVIAGTSRAKRIDSVIVATTTNPADDAIVRLCRDSRWLWSRGNESDVLDRYLDAATEHRAQIVVRITSDCPLVDPGVIDLVVDRLLETGPADYASNTLEPRTYPRGLDVEAFTYETLVRAWKKDDEPGSREHVTPYVYRHPEVFRLVRVALERDLSGHRWTVDTAEDLELVRLLYANLPETGFDWSDVLALAETHPEWIRINAHVEQRRVPDPGSY